LRLDLTIYPGFSGGPVIDAESCVVALTTVGPRSLVLGIPTATVERVTQQLLATGRIARGYLGIGMQPVRLSERLRPLANAELAVILVAVEAEGPAEQAGLLLGDILITLAGVTIRDTGDVQAVLGSAAVGQTIPVRVIRGGQLLELALTIGERRGERE
jgi:S1-C subfamily serine protease